MSDEREPWRGGQWQQFWPEEPAAREAPPGQADRQPQQGLDEAETAAGDSDDSAGRSD